MTNYLPQFIHFLRLKNYSPVTIRNYLSDINKYFSFAGQQNVLANHTLFAYIKHLSTKNNRSRYLASLNVFCQFAVDQNLIPRNPLKKLKFSLGRTPQITLKQLLEQYQNHLQKYNVSQNTIRNYLNDIKQFIHWSTSSAT